MISGQAFARGLAVAAWVAGVSLVAEVHVRAQHVSEPAAAMSSPRGPASAADIAAGEVLYARRCAVCHGPKGEGGRGPTLARATLPRAADAESLRRIIQRGIEDTAMPSSRLTPPEVAQVAAFVSHLGRLPPERVRGNASRGARLYAEKGGCAACHAIQGQGGAFGPDLTDVGRRRGAAYLRTSLLDPEADVTKGFSIYRNDVSITENFLQVRATTHDGRQVVGARVNEDSFSIQLRDATGALHSFFKSELADLRKEWGRSPMPTYRGVFADAELDDLVAYLAALVGAQK